MNFHRVRLGILCAGLLALLVKPCAAKEGIVLNEKEYFEGPGLSFLLFHNNYQVGFQGGLQMILNGERVLDSGDLLLVPRGGEWPSRNCVSCGGWWIAHNPLPPCTAK